MRRCLLLVLLLAGCFDFDALMSGGPRPDGGFPPDLSGDLLCNTGAAIEDCTNGIDDNGDCMVDCDDPGCKGSGLCQPFSLSGYGRLMPTCGAEMEPSGPELFDAIDPAKPCGTCTCNNPTGCASRLRFHNTTNCTDAPTAMFPLSMNQCVTPLTFDAAMAQRFVLERPALICAPGAATVPPVPAHKGRSQLCLPAGAKKDCDTLACVLQGQAMRSGLCIAVAEQTCPDPFSQAAVRYRTYSDTRTCGCACESPTGTVCMGNVTLSKKTNCAGAGMEYVIPAADIAMCKAFPAMFPMGITGVDYRSTPIAAMRCTASSTASAGEAKVDSPLTICCIP